MVRRVRTDAAVCGPARAVVGACLLTAPLGSACKGRGSVVAIGDGRNHNDLETRGVVTSFVGRGSSTRDVFKEAQARRDLERQGGFGDPALRSFSGGVAGGEAKSKGFRQPGGSVGRARFGMAQAAKAELDGSGIKDKAGVLLFGLVVGFALFLAVWTPVAHPNAPPRNVEEVDPATGDVSLQPTIYYELLDAGATTYVPAVAGVAMFANVLFAQALLAWPTGALIGVHVTAMLVFLAGTLVCFFSSTFGWGAFWLIFFLGQGVYIMLAYPALKHARSIIQLITKVLRRHPTVLLLGVLLGVFSMVFFGCWIFLFAWTAPRMHWAFQLGLFLELMLLGQICRFITYTTAAGVFAAWYYDKDYFGSKPVKRTLHRTLRSIGSVMWAALMTSISRVLMAIAGFLRTNNIAWLQALAVVAISLDAFARKYNSYGLVHVATTGSSFVKSSKKSYDSLTRAGIRPIMADGAVQGVSFMGSFLVSVGSVGVAWLLIGDRHIEGSGFVLVTLPCFIVGATLGLFALEALDAMLATFYVCFSEHPQFLKDRDEGAFIETMDMLLELGDDELTESEDERSIHSDSSGVEEAMFADYSDNDSEEEEEDYDPRFEVEGLEDGKGERALVVTTQP